MAIPVFLLLAAARAAGSRGTHHKRFRLVKSLESFAGRPLIEE
jgi:hypothetical protein